MGMFDWLFGGSDREPEPEPEPEQEFVPAAQWPMKSTCPVHHTPLNEDFRCQQCGSGWQFRSRDND